MLNIEGWQAQSLGDLISLEYGASLSEAIRVDGEYPVYGSNGQIGKHTTFLVRGPGIIVGRKGTVGAVIWSDNSFWPIDTTYYVNLHKNHDLRWCYWQLLSLPIARMDSSTGVPGLNRNDVYKLWLNVPSPSEQSFIAHILDTLDTQIQLTEQLIAKLKQIKIGLLHDLFTQGVDENGDVRDPVAHPEKFKKSALGSIPRVWNVGKFEALANIIDPQPSHRAPAEVVDGEPYVGVGDIREDGSMNFESCRKVSLKAVTKQEQRFSIEAGDIIFGKIGTIGFPQLLPQGIRYALNANTVIIKPKHCPSYVLWLLRSSLIEKQIQVQIHSTSQPAFGIQRIRAMLVPLPDKNEQHRISLILDSHNARITVEESYLVKLKQLKKGLMHDLLTGRVRVTQLIEESEHLDVRSKSVSGCEG